MTRPSPRTLALWLAFVIPAVPARPAAAQAKKPADAPAKEAKAKDKEKADDAEARPPSPFGDPKRFTRFGGWGSFGNAMGQFGFGRSTLVMSPAVQKELKLTEAQKDDLRKWLDSLRKDGEDLGRRLRDQGEAADPFRANAGGGGDDVPIAGRIMQFTGMIAQFSAMMQQNENGLARILTAAQRRRLDQIALQMEGVSALLRPEVAEAVNLGPVEQEMIQEILNNARTQQMGTWFGSMIRMRSAGRPAPDAADPPAETSERPRSRTRTPAKSDKPAADKPTDDKAEPDKPAADTAEAARTRDRAERQKAMRQQFEAMRDRTDGIQADAVREVVRLLSKGQRARFEKLLGPPFDPAALNFGPPPQRPGAESR